MKAILLLVISTLPWLPGCNAKRTERPQSVNAPGERPPAASSPAAPREPVSGNSRSENTADLAAITAEVQRLVAATTGVEVRDVSVDTPLSKLKKPVDELDVVEIIMGVEDRFGIEIRDDELGGGDAGAATNITVKQIAAIVASRKGVNK